MTLAARIIFLFCLLISASALGQISSSLGGFQVNQNKGCSGLEITITLGPGKTCNSSSPCDFDVIRDGQTFASGQNPTTFKFNEPGVYKFRMLFQGGATDYDQVDIVVTPSTPPKFELYTCAANQVAINITDTNFDSYIVDYGDGKASVTYQRNISLSGSYSYDASGVKNVTVRGRNNSAADNCGSATQSINVMATLPIPTINLLEVLDASSIRVAFNGQPNIVYRLEVAPNNAPSFQNLKTLYNVTFDTIRNLKTDDNFYCYRLGVVNPCTGQIQYSPVICSTNADIAIENNQNIFSWQTRTTGVTNYRVTRTTSGSSIATTVAASPYNDLDVTCGRNYCYQVTTLYPNSAQSISLTKCGTAKSNTIPPAVENISTQVNGANVDLLWQSIPNFPAEEYSVYKNISNVYNATFKTTTTSLTDPSYSADSEMCYKIQFKDVCGNQSPLSNSACPITLTGSLQGDNAISLSWSAYNGWTNGVLTYTVQKYTPEGALLQTFTTSSTTFEDDTEDVLHQALVYVITATPSESGISPSVSNRITIVKNPNLFYPRAFTPNGDNLNDIFNVFGQFIEDFEMSIFNRWGELMYTTQEITEGWDGNYKGNQMPEGTYTFIVRIVDRAGRDIKESGSVLLLRKK